MQCVQALSDASQAGLLPSAEALKSEEETFEELTALRQSLLDALHAHNSKARSGT